MNEDDLRFLREIRRLGIVTDATRGEVREFGAMEFRLAKDRLVAQGYLHQFLDGSVTITHAGDLLATENVPLEFPRIAILINEFAGMTTCWFYLRTANLPSGATRIDRIEAVISPAGILAHGRQLAEARGLPPERVDVMACPAPGA